MICKTLNHFKILDRLEKGGMGEVYVAEDRKLKRRVALKVLPEEVARDPARLDRFQREAESIAALNHPNIVTIFMQKGLTLTIKPFPICFLKRQDLKKE
jgi:serine/threonine protein kinase